MRLLLSSFSAASAHADPAPFFLSFDRQTQFSFLSALVFLLLEPVERTVVCNCLFLLCILNIYRASRFSELLAMLMTLIFPSPTTFPCLRTSEDLTIRVERHVQGSAKNGSLTGGSSGGSGAAAAPPAPRDLQAMFQRSSEQQVVAGGAADYSALETRLKG